jgi:hypothetical protein
MLYDQESHPKKRVFHPAYYIRLSKQRRKRSLMIQRFIDRFMARKSELEAVFAKKHPKDYKAIVTQVAKILTDPDKLRSVNDDLYLETFCGWDNDPDPKRVHEIDDGDWQGTLLYVIGARGYQPDTYWYVKVEYGSCSGCDTLQAIRDNTHENPTPEQVKDYMTLALHIVEGLKGIE